MSKNICSKKKTGEGCQDNITSPSLSQYSATTKLFFRQGDYTMNAEKLKSGNWRVRASYQESGKQHVKSFTAPKKSDAIV